MARQPGTDSRDGAFLSMTSPLGKDVLLPTVLQGHEAISEVFEFQIDVISRRDDIKADELLGSPVCVHLRQSGQPVRHFHGIVRRFERPSEALRDFTAYRLTLVPKLFLLSQTEDCRVFQQKNSIDIINTLLEDAGIDQVAIRAYAKPPVRPYTVQYNESDLTFISRLMQEDGLFYFFEHSPSGHTLVISDANTVFQAIPDDEMRLMPAGPGTTDCVTDWRPRLATAHGSAALTDYDPVSPPKRLSANVSTRLKAAGAAQRDFYRWPAHTEEPEVVKQRARIRMDAAEAAAALAEGACHNPRFVPGGKFRLRAGGANTAYVIHSVTHRATDETNIAGGAAISYAARFTAFDASVPWRDQPTIPRPRMDGIHSAIVIGVQGEEIYTDDLARVKIRFHWDRLHGSTPEGSCWVRVVQPWAGNGWGWQFLPRVGTEVAVAFMNGDVDEPVIIGGMYNGDQKPIFQKSDKTRSGLRTRSSSGGGTSDFSEFSVDDKTGSEMVFLHAQRDHKVEVENDQTVTVSHDRTLTVQHDETVKIGNNLSVQVDNAATVKIAEGRTVTIQASGDTLKVQSGDLTRLVETGNISEKASVGAITIEALQGITLKVGQSSVKIDQTGVTVSGMMVKVEGQVQLTLQGLMTDLKGDAMVMVKGGILMLN